MLQVVLNLSHCSLGWKAALSVLLLQNSQTPFFLFWAQGYFSGFCKFRHSMKAWSLQPLKPKVIVAWWYNTFQQINIVNVIFSAEFCLLKTTLILGCPSVPSAAWLLDSPSNTHQCRLFFFMALPGVREEGLSQLKLHSASDKVGIYIIAWSSLQAIKKSLITAYSLPLGPFQGVTRFHKELQAGAVVH